MRIKNAAGSKNLSVDFSEAISVSAMEEVLGMVAARMQLYISHTTTLGRTKYPGNRHWHFKQGPKVKGCLDVTYWPGGRLMWITIRHSEPTWVHESGEAMKKQLEQALSR